MKVLVVEDSPTLRTSYREELNDHEIEVIEADAVERACVLFDRHKDEIVVVTLDMCLNPHGHPDGVQVIRHIRGSGSHVPVIAASSNVDNNLSLLQHGCTTMIMEGRRETVPPQVRRVLRALGLVPRRVHFA